MISFLLTVLKIVFLLGFLVLIHEGGHFLIAKLCKVKVNEFAIGFGSTIWKKQGKETKYALRAIPLGGFVSMEGEEERSEEEGSFSKASIPKRIAIVIAGGTVNIIFGLLVYFILGACTGNYISNKVESIQREQTVIQVNDEIVAINDKKIRLYSDIQEELTDVFIYLLKLSYQLDIDLEKAYVEKMAKNRERFLKYEKQGTKESEG